MILTVDIGNTNIVLGEWDETELVFVSRLQTDKQKTEDGYAIELKIVLELYGADLSKIEGAIISSVVPQITGAMEKAVEKLIGKKPLVVGPGVKTGLNIRIDDPAQLGSDLVAAAVAALAKYPKPIVIFDLGTATTISVINREGAFLGGVIVPGIRVGLDALSNNAAQLSQVSLDAPRDIIGTNSIDGMKSGAVYATASMIDGMAGRMEKRLGEKASVIATGGNSRDIVKYCACDIHYDPDILLEGLRMIYQRNRQTS